MVMLLAGAALLFAGLQASAQQFAKPPRIGVLLFGADDTMFPPVVAMREGLRQRGYSEEKNTVSFEYRHAEGRLERLRPLADELVRAKVDLLFAGGDQAIMAVKLAAKRLEILREVFPNLARVGVFLNPGDRRMQAELSETEKAGKAWKIAIQPVPPTRLDDFAAAFSAATAARNQALVVTFDSVTFLHRRRLAEMAIANRLATIHNFREYVDSGAVLSYGPNLVGMWGSATAHVEKIFKGARPGDLPVEQPTKFELVINLKSAKAMGVTIPPSVLVRADEVIR